MDKFVSPEKPPEGIERELLTILAEECCEVGQRVSKALRFGLTEVQPDQLLDNKQRISDELGDILGGVLDRMDALDLIDHNVMQSARIRKDKKLKVFLQS